MRYGLKAKAEGTISLRERLSIESDDIRTTFFADAEGRLDAIEASVSVPAEDFATTVGPGTGHSKATITLKGNPDVHARLLQHLRAIESNLAFSSGGALRRLHWDTAKEEREAENDDEERYISVTELGREFIDQRPTVVLDTMTAKAIIDACTSHRELIVPLAFWREALNEYCDRRYIQAYYNFYFVIEGFYAHGKSSERGVLRAFQRSQELTEVTEWVLQQTRRHASHWENLQALYRDAHCDPGVVGTQRLLIRIRGRLHHYFHGSSKRQHDPFAQIHFETPAWIALNFATMAILKRGIGLPVIWPVS